MKLKCACGAMLNPQSTRNKDQSTYKRKVSIKRSNNKRSCRSGLLDLHSRDDLIRRVVSYKKEQKPTVCCVTYRCNKDTCKCTYSIHGKSKRAIFRRVKNLDIEPAVAASKRGEK